jgi:aspartyl-tRNA(Asn)/glutamyl-tRNA(Gln) amidotransferase subunit A
VTGAGSRSLPGTLARRSAHAVRKIEAAGGIVHGKTETVEFAFGGWGTNVGRGTPRNPYDLALHRVPGGSSSGSAVAVAAGLAVAALGTDTGGSVRTPASYRGVVGLKTTRGLIGRSGVFPLSPSLYSVGVLTRSVCDAAAMLDVLQGLDNADEATFHAPHVNPIADLEKGVAGLRLGRLPDRELAGVSAEVRNLVEQVLVTLGQAGARVVAFEPPRPLENYLFRGGELMSAESYANLAAYVDPEDSSVEPAIRARVLRGREISASGYIGIIEDRKLARREMLVALDRLDALVMPTCLSTAIPADRGR